MTLPGATGITLPPAMATLVQTATTHPAGAATLAPRPIGLTSTVTARLTCFATTLLDATCTGSRLATATLAVLFITSAAGAATVAPTPNGPISTVTARPTCSAMTPPDATGSSSVPATASSPMAATT